MIVQFTWGWVMQTIPKQPPGLRADAFNVHKSIGLTILALMVLRALWRWRHPAPAAAGDAGVAGHARAHDARRDLRRASS